MGMVLSWSAALFLSAVMAAAAQHKLRSLSHFAGQIRDYQLLPSWLEAPVTRILPGLELLLALGLLLPWSRHWAAAAALVLMLAYAAAIGINLLRGRSNIDCGCSGPAVKQPLSPMLLIRNGVLLMAAGTCVFAPTSLLPGLAAGLVALAAALVAALLYLALDTFLLNRSLLASL